MSWTKVKVGDLGRIVTGKTPKTADRDNYNGSIMFVTPSDNMEAKYIYSTGKTITEKGKLSVKGAVIPAGAVCVSCIGSNLGKVIITTEECVTNQQINSIIVDVDKYDTDFVYYAMLILGKELNFHSKTSTAVPIVNKSTFSSYEISCPPIEEQRQIASVLTALDDKIANNTEINENLLQQAKALFKSWFVDFDPFEEDMVEAPIGSQIPQSLKMVQIQDLPHIIETGKRPKGGAVSSGIPSVGAENVKKLGVFDSSSAKYIPHEFAMTMKKGKIEGYELLMYKDGGKPGTFIPHFSMFGEGFPYEEFYINEHVFKLDFHDRGYNEFAFLYMQTDYPYHWLANNGGKAAIPGINKQNVNEIWIYHPSHPRVQEFCSWVQPVFTTIFTNCAQNMKLSKIRDALLPKLMSGELDVSEIDI